MRTTAVCKILQASAEGFSSYCLEVAFVLCLPVLLLQLQLFAQVYILSYIST